MKKIDKMQLTEKQRWMAWGEHQRQGENLLHGGWNGGAYREAYTFNMMCDTVLT